MNGIKNIVFDLGMVILNIDFNASEREFKKYGINNFDEIYSRAKQINLFDKLEEGKITSEEFRKELKNLFKTQISDNSLDIAWNAILLDFPEERIRFLQKIKSQYRIFLLSNTNEIHFKHYSNNFKNKFGFEFVELFEYTYLSFKVGLRKPDIKIFQYVLDNSSLDPENTLFIDDTLEHINAAKTLGIKTYHLKDYEDISKLEDFKIGKL